MTVRFFTDAYADVPYTQRGRMEQELRRLKMMHWADPADRDLLERIAEAEAALRAFNGSAP